MPLIIKLYTPENGVLNALVASRTACNNSLFKGFLPPVCAVFGSPPFISRDPFLD